MKKFLSLLASLTLATTTTLSVVSCAKNTDLPSFHNPDYIPEDLHQTDAEKQAINDAIVARLKAAVLTDVYKINKQQTSTVAFRAFSNDKKDLQTAFLNNFTERDFLASVPEGTKNLDLYGTRGYNGGVLDYITKDLKIDSVLDFMKDFLKIDLKSQVVKDKIFGLLQTGRGVLQTFDGQYLAKNLPDFLKLIPDDLLENVPSPILKNLPSLSQKLIEFVLPQTTLNPIFQGLVDGTNLTAYKDFTTAQVGDAIVVNFINFYGYGTNPEFNPFDPVALGQSGDLSSVGKYLFDHRDDLTKFDLRNNLQSGLNALMQFLCLFNCVMSAYKTPDVKKSDDNHIFSTAQDNASYVAELQTKTLASFNYDLTHFHLGSLVSNLAYYFGQPTLEGQRLGLAKFGYLLTYHGIVSDTNPLPSFWKLIFGMVQANPKTQQTGEQLPQLYNETFGPRLLNPIFANQPWNLVAIKDKTANPTLWKIIDEGPTPGLEKSLELGARLFGNHPLEVLMNGDLRGLFDSFGTFFDPDDFQRFQADLHLLFGTSQKINGTTLLQLKLGTILGWAKINPFPTDRFGLVPDYVGYYTNRSLRELVLEAALTFKFNGSELPVELKYYYFDFQLLQQLTTRLLYDNKKTANQGFLADFIQAYRDGEDLNELIGYQLDANNPKNFNQIRRDSFLGTLLELFVPPIGEGNSELIDVKASFQDPIVTNNDHATWYFDAIMSVMINCFRPTPYTDFLNRALRVDNAFSVKQELVYESGTAGDLMGGTYTLTFNDEILAKALGYDPIVTGIKTYTLTFSKSSKAENYHFTKFTKN